PPVGPLGVGAIEQGMAELKGEAATGESVVDRSPPPPVAPPKAAAPAGMVMPPPPARSLRARKGADAPTAPAPTPAPDALDGDAIFGSMENGDIGGGGAPFA